MASISTTSYVLDSRNRSAGSTLTDATFNFAALGSPVEAGTYEMLSFSSRNGVYNVDDSNDEIYYNIIDFIYNRLKPFSPLSFIFNTTFMLLKSGIID